MNIPKCLKMQARAKKRIPGMTQLLSKRPDQFSLGIWPSYYRIAKGVELWDLDGNHYIDMSIAGIGANVLGYADDDVDAAVKEAISNGSSSSLNCPEEVELAELLCKLHPWAEMVRFARTGGESMAIAIRIARTHTGKEKIAFCGYHGWHDWYLAANLGTEDALGDHLLKGLSPKGVPKGLKGTALPFHYNSLNELQDIISRNRNDLAAIVLEPIRSTHPTREFLKGVRILANETGSVLIVDEISSGFRMNSGGAHSILGLEPDIAVFSKAMGNGYPVGAIIGRANFMQAAQNTFISSTQWTERLGSTAALATINKHVKVNAGDHLMLIGRLIQEGWKKISSKYALDIDVGGIPPLSHFVFKADNPLAMKALFIQLMLEQGFLASNLFYAMYAHKTNHVKGYLAAVDKAFSEIYRLHQTGQIEKSLKGKPANEGFKRMT